jgi:RNA-directed DNA polymerase
VQPKPLCSPRVPVNVRFAACYCAWRKASRGKRPSQNQLQFASRWLDKLQQLHADLRAGTWVPRRAVSFVVHRPKTREVHAPDFADRVVHHLLVPPLERLFEPVFIHDSYANRAGRGSHAAVDRLQHFVRQRNGQGWFLQLDVHNFFNSIHRPTLYALLKDRLAHAQRQGALRPQQVRGLQSLCHKLLAQPVQEWVSQPLAAKRVPAHKRLRNAPPGCGLPIGNLTSQFFANVYLNELDQFAKHQLKARHYLRYVDDFVLLADSPQQLQDWQGQIAQFLAQRLQLRLKADMHLAPLGQGIDFLGYVVWHSHRRVRQRVVDHCVEKLAAWQQRHLHQRLGQWHLQASAPALAQLQATVGSYWGHFAHAQSARLCHGLWQRFACLQQAFACLPSGQLRPRWVLQGTTLAEQVQWLRQQWPEAHCVVQKGYEWLHYPPLQQGTSVCTVRAEQTGWLRHGTRRREITHWSWPAGQASNPPPSFLLEDFA